MTQKYEALLLTVPEITGDETKNLESQIDKLIKAAQGSILSFERWGKYKLAYPVKKDDYGVYFLVRFEAPKGSSLINDMKTIFKVKFNDVVLRNMVSALEAQQPLVYQRPRSLEEAPTRDVESFLKENKMSGLLPSVESDEESKKEVAKEESEEA